VIAKQFSAGFPAQVVKVERAFQDDDLDQADLCFAATDDPRLNARIVQLCADRRVLVNRADREEGSPGDFTVPAVHRAGPITLAVSASGSPALAAAIRSELAGKLDPAWPQYAEVALQLRKQVLGSDEIPATRRPEVLRFISSQDAIAAYQRGGRQELWAAVQRLASVEEGGRMAT
jgi:siroheme synthase-like protein